jgi:hypothetical protein
MKKLEIGDKIAFKHYNNIGILGTVDKVTDKFAFCSNNKFKRDYSDNGTIELSKPETWPTIRYFIPDEEVMRQIYKKRMIRYIEKYNFDNTSYEDIKKVYSIIKSK